MFDPLEPPLVDVQVAAYPVMAALPSLAGLANLTVIEPVPADADTPVGADGGVPVDCVVTAKVPATPPIVSVTVVVVPELLAEV